MRIVSIVPARANSKGVPRKNIKELNGQPLIAYSILDSLRSELIEETYVTTDSPEIGRISKKYGAEVPFMRPAKYAKDGSIDLEWMRHFLAWFRVTKDYLPEYVVHLRPTTPLREPKIIDKAIRKLIDNPSSTSLRSVHEVEESPYKMFHIEDSRLEGIFPSYPVKEYYNLPRQRFPKAYKPNGYVDIIRPEIVINKCCLHGSNMLAFETPHTTEIDTIEEFNYLEYLLTNQ